MKELPKHIEPGIGLGPLKFGLLREEIKEIIGIPDEIEFYRYSSSFHDESEAWHFEELELSITFSREDEGRMYAIAINSAFYSLWDSIHIGQSISVVKEILTTRGITDYEFEDWSSVESPDHKLIELTESYVNLWFDNGELSEIQWSPKFEDDETIIWPHFAEPNPKQTELGIKIYPTDYLFSELEKSLEEWLDKIFREIDEYEDLLNEFPFPTQRENLITINSSINYYLNIEDRVEGSIMAKARLVHNLHGDIGWMAMEWDNDLDLMDNFLVLE